MSYVKNILQAGSGEQVFVNKSEKESFTFASSEHDIVMDRINLTLFHVIKNHLASRYSSQLVSFSENLQSPDPS